MTASKTTSSKTTKTDTGWTAIPAPPKVPNYHQGFGYTLMYVNPGWAVYPGTFSSKTEKPDTAPLFHSRKAAAAKAWVEEHATATAKPAAKQPAKPKPAPKPADTTGEQT